MKARQADNAIDYIKKHAKGDKPFFMDVNFMKMHNRQQPAQYERERRLKAVCLSSYRFGPPRHGRPFLRDRDRITGTPVVKKKVHSSADASAGRRLYAALTASRKRLTSPSRRWAWPRINAVGSTASWGR